MVDLQTGATFEVNHVGAHVWTLMGTGSTLATIVEGIRSTFDVDTESVTSDIGRLCSEMLAAGLIDQVD